MKSLHVTKRGQFAFFFTVLSLLIVIPDCRADDGFMKDASSNCAVFKPNFRIGETVVWKGQCQHGFAQGAGVAKWTAYDGTTVMFEGTFMEGKLQGKGKMTASGGDRYDGDYKDGKREGHGVYLSANGERYEGEYKDNQRIGRGVLLRRCLQECLRDFRQVFAHNAQVVPRNRIRRVQCNGFAISSLSFFMALERDSQHPAQVIPRGRVSRVQCNGFAESRLSFFMAIERASQHSAQVVPRKRLCGVQFNGFAVSRLGFFMALERASQHVAQAAPRKKRVHRI